MKKYISLLVTLVVTLFAMNALAFNPPPAPARGGYVVDQTGKLSDSQIQQLNRKIDQISKTTKNEFGILFLRDMGGDNIEDVASSTFKSWGVGKHGLDNGVLIVVALKEHKSRIETGKGVEGDVPDLRAHDILQNNLNPHLKRGDFYGGFDDALNALSSLIESRHNQKAEPRPIATNPATTSQPSTQTAPRSGGCAIAAGPGASDDGGSFWVILALFGGIGAVGWYLVRRARRKAQEEAEAQLEAERARQRRIAARQKEEADERRERLRVLHIATPVVTVPEVPHRAPVVPSTRPTVPRPTPRATVSSIPPAAAATAAASALASQEALQARLRREREEQETAAKRRRQRDEEDRRKRQREDDDRRSSSSSYSSSSSSSDYSSGGGSSGGGFGGGDSGGGGSSSDW